MLPDLSVVICTHNPRPDYLARVLDSLRQQTLSPDRWELLLVDNHSREPLRDRVDVTWHPRGRHCREEELGLTPARLRGIAETRSPVLAFIDDDNVLEPDYLERGWAIAEAWPILGAWGAGKILPAFDEPPAEWTRPYWGLLAIRDLEQDRWSNRWDRSTVPCGAGLFVRRAVAEHYAQVLRNDALRKGLDRRGTSLVSSGDMDLSLTACDLGLGTGLFPSLRLTHLIPASRLTEEYLVRLWEAKAYSEIVLTSARESAVPSPSWRRRLLDHTYALLSARRDRRFRLAALRGQAAARSLLRRSGQPGRQRRAEEAPIKEAEAVGKESRQAP